MDRCPLCNSRMMETEHGERCMNAKCEGSKEIQAQAGVICQCGEEMNYVGLNSLGEPRYACTACGATTKL